MAIGNWGTDIVFRVSEREALLLQSLNRTVSAEWAAHSRLVTISRRTAVR